MSSAAHLNMLYHQETYASSWEAGFCIYYWSNFNLFFFTIYEYVDFFFLFAFLNFFLNKIVLFFFKNKRT